MATLFPAIHGYRVNPGVELSDGWSAAELKDVMYQLGAAPDDQALLLESCSGEEADAMMNPGGMILEAVTAQYNRLGRTMAALARVLNKHLGEGLSVDGDAFIGPDRKNALFAYKTVTFNISDGQAVSVLFHSPDNDPKRFQPDETLVAYRWMLNKRDITASVAPERGRDITLELMARRMGQLIEANSSKFKEQAAAREANAQALAEAESRREELRTRSGSLTDEVVALEDDLQAVDSRMAKLADRLQAERERNERLRQSAGGQGGQQGEAGMPVMIGDSINPDWYQANMGNQEVLDSNAEALNSFFGSDRVPAVREALRKAGWTGSAMPLGITNNGKEFTFGVEYKLDESGDNITGARYTVKVSKLESFGFSGEVIDTFNIDDDLSMSAEALAESINRFAMEHNGAANHEPGSSEIERSEISVDTYNNWIKSSVNVTTRGGWKVIPDPLRKKVVLARKFKEVNQAGGGYVRAEMVSGFTDKESAEAWAKANPVKSKESIKPGTTEGDSQDLPGGNDNNNTNPDKPSTTEGFEGAKFADPRTQVAYVLAEELAMAGFTAMDFPASNPDFELGQYQSVAGTTMASGSANVYVNSVEGGQVEIEVNYNPEPQPGLMTQASSRETFTVPVPVGILEGKFDDVVAQIDDWLAQFRTQFDDVELPGFGSKLAIDGVNQHDATDIAKRIRQDIKAMMPAGFKPSMFSVKTSKYSMGQSIGITIKSVPEGFKVFDDELGENQFGESILKMTREALALKKSLQAIGNSYRYDNSDAMTDYFDTNFYFDVTFDRDLTESERKRVNAAQSGSGNKKVDEVVAKLLENFKSDTVVQDNIRTFLDRHDASRDGETYAKQVAENWYFNQARGQIMAGGDMGIDVKDVIKLSDSFQSQAASYIVARMAEMESADPVEPTTPIDPVEPGNAGDQGEQNVNEAEAIGQELQKLANGEVTDTGVFDQMLDELAERAEAAGLMDELDGLLNAAADKLTELLEQEANNV